METNTQKRLTITVDQYCEISSTQKTDVLRRGQAMYDKLDSINRELAMEINHTEFDPFYDDSKILPFLKHISEFIKI